MPARSWSFHFHHHQRLHIFISSIRGYISSSVPFPLLVPSSFSVRMTMLFLLVFYIIHTKELWNYLPPGTCKNTHCSVFSDQLNLSLTCAVGHMQHTLFCFFGSAKTVTHMCRWAHATHTILFFGSAKTVTHMCRRAHATHTILFFLDQQKPSLTCAVGHMQHTLFCFFGSVKTVTHMCRWAHQAKKLLGYMQPHATHTIQDVRKLIGLAIFTLLELRS